MDKIMLLKKICLISFVMVLFNYIQTPAKIAKELNDGDVVSSSDFSADSRYAHGSAGLVNLLTGTSRYQLNLVSVSSKSGLSVGVSLFYCGAVDGSDLKDNNTAPTGIVGLGWSIGFTTIYVEYKGTVDIADDEYFYKSTDGSIDNIMRQGTSKETYVYQIKSHPYWKVTPYFASNVIAGWTIFLPDGTQYRYGVSASGPEDYTEHFDAQRYIPCDDVNIYDCGTKKFYYQWDLASIKDVNGGVISFTYDRDIVPSCKSEPITIPGKESYMGSYDHWWNPAPSCADWWCKNQSTSGHYDNLKGCCIADDASSSAPWFPGGCLTSPPAMTQRNKYDGDIFPPIEYAYFCKTADQTIPEKNVADCVSGSYIQSIVSDNGDIISFDYSLKSTKELGKYNKSEVKYLDAILLKQSNVSKNRIDFIYGSSAGQLGDINAGTNNQKRLLAGITQTIATGELNRRFEYCQVDKSPGLLKKIIEPMTGATTCFKYGIQNIVKNSKTYGVTVVKQTVLSSGVTINPDIVTSYAYSSAIADQDIDLESGIGYFGNVKTTTGTGAGFTITKFDLDKAKTTNLLGACTGVENYTSSSKLVSSVSYEYLAKMFGPATPTTSQWYLPVLKTTTTTMNGIATKSGVSVNAVDIDENNGGTCLSWSIGADGKALVTKRAYAYKDNLAGMGPTGLNMLIQESSNKIYQVSGFNPTTCDISTGTVVKASYNVWSNASGVWRPSATYVWKSDMNASGLPISTFHDFDAAHPTDNGWQCTGTIDKYDAVGAAIQVTDASNMSSTVIYGTPFHAPVASVTNAKYGECYFTSFEQDETWTFSSGTPSIRSTDTDKQKNGQYSGLINNSTIGTKLYALSQLRTLDQGLTATKKFTFSGWVYTTGPQAEIYFFANLTQTFEEGHFASVTTPADAANKWVFLQGTFDAPVGAKYFNLRIDNNGKVGANTKVYFDDLKFYPSGALMSCTYYDPTWRKPILTVDANERYSALAEFDTYGRPSKTYKIKADGTKVLASLKEYHLMGQDLRVVTPNGGEILAPGQQFSIAWSGVATQGTNGVDITYSSDNGSTWTPITNATQLKTTNSFLWTVPSTVGTSCLIQVKENGSTTNFDQSDATFIVSDYLKVTSPAGGETWWGGKRNAPPWSTNPHAITWTTTGGTDANVRIDYFDGKAWNNITPSTSNIGTYDWILGQLDPCGLTRIRISDATTGLRARESEKFNIYVNHGFVRRLKH